MIGQQPVGQGIIRMLFTLKEKTSRTKSFSDNIDSVAGTTLETILISKGITVIA